MPIFGLTDRQSLQTSDGFELIGRIYKGAERTEEDKKRNRPGKDLPHFRVVLEPRFAHLQTAWNEIYGENPEQFRHVYLLRENTDDAFPTWREEWAASGLLRRCDGLRQVEWLDAARGRISREPVACVHSAPGGCKCKDVGRLKLMLLEFSYETGAFGYFQLVTHSLYDIKHLSAVLFNLEKLYGQLNKVPYVLGKKEQMVPVPEIRDGQPTGKRIPTKKHLLHLRIDENFVRERLLNAATFDSRQMLEVSAAPALPDVVEDAEPELLSPPPPAQDITTAGIFADAGKREAFLAWAKGWFKLDEADVIAALSVAQDGLWQLTEWDGDAALAKAACLAYRGEYTEDKIEALTATKFYPAFGGEDNAFDAYNAACEIADRRNARMDVHMEAVAVPEA